MSTPQDLKLLNALVIAFGHERSRKLLQRCGSYKKAWSARAGTMIGVGVRQSTIAELTRKRDALNPEVEWQKITALGVEVIGLEEKRYPAFLREIYSPPIILYARGDCSVLAGPKFAVVGTRAPSSYGRSVVGSIVPRLVGAGLTIVSGLAQGIDALAHYAALDSGGKVIAVLGSGVDELRPKINESLGKKILAEGGLVLSEYPLGTESLRQHFPARNRIIAGLSLGVLVVESRDPGGSLITAARALESGREIFAIPGPINRPTSDGTNRLIQQGAKLVTRAEDILEELAINARGEIPKVALENLNREEKEILEVLEAEPLHIDTISKRIKLSPSQANALMGALELKGAVRNNGGNIYERIT